MTHPDPDPSGPSPDKKRQAIDRAIDVAKNDPAANIIPVTQNLPEHYDTNPGEKDSDDSFGFASSVRCPTCFANIEFDSQIPSTGVVCNSCHSHVKPTEIETSYAAEHAIGTFVGPYKLLQVIGQGGMGTVYMAEQTEPVRRRVAVKVIKPGMDSREVIARFEAERQALAMMDHPNIARVLDAGMTKPGRPYFVMELVKGIPITRYCDSQRLSPRERLELFIPICQAVQHAHQKGIIHRDLKPSNLLVAMYDSRPVPKIIDFGVAKATAGNLTEKTMFTRLGQIVGTLEYMSPEQAQFNQLDIDTRSDIYSLGTILYEVLTGTTPITHQRMQSAALDEVIRMIRDEEPQRPSTRLSTTKNIATIAASRHMAADRLSTMMRGDLDWIVMKSLEKDRTRRYESAHGMALDILRYLNDEPVLACPPTARYKLAKFMRRNRIAVATCSLVLTALIAGLVMATWGYFTASLARQDAIVQRDEALRQRSESQVNLVGAKRNLDLAVAAVEQFCTQVADDQRLKQADLRPLRSQLLKTAIEFQHKLLLLRPDTDVANTELAKTWSRLGELTTEIDAPSRAIECYQNAIVRYETVLETFPDDEQFKLEFASCLNQLARSLTATGQAEIAFPKLDRAAVTLESMLQEDSSCIPARKELALTCSLRGHALSTIRRFGEATEYFRQGVEQQKLICEINGDKTVDLTELALAHQRLAESLISEGLANWRAAEKQLLIALEIQRRAVAQEDAGIFERSLLGLILRSLAKTAKVSNRVDEARNYLTESCTIFQELALEEPSVLHHNLDLGLSWYQVSSCAILAKDQDAGIEALHKAIGALEQVVAKSPEDVFAATWLGQSFSNMGDILMTDDADHALEYFDRAATIFEEVLVRAPDDRNAISFLPAMLATRGRLLAERKRFEKALMDAERATALAANDDAEAIRLNCSMIFAMAGDYERATVEAKTAVDALAARCNPHFMITSWQKGALIFAESARLAALDPELGNDERESRVASYIEQAIAMLKSAVEAGLDPRSLSEAGGLENLRDLPEFKKLVNH